MEKASCSDKYNTVTAKYKGESSDTQQKPDSITIIRIFFFFLFFRSICSLRIYHSDYSHSFICDLDNSDVQKQKEINMKKVLK